MPASTPAPPVGKPVILVVEDEPGIADTLHYVLASDGFEPLHCASAREAVERFAARAPDLAILDVGLPEIDRILGLELGADDYVAKPFSPRELVARVRTILRRSQRGEAAENAADSKEKPTSARLDTAPTAIENEATRPTRHGPFELDAERRLIRYHGQRLDLARYEYGLLATLIQRPGRVFTRGELLARMWDERAESFDRTVDAHVKTLRAKLRAVRPGDDPIRTLRGVGYALNE